MIDLIIFIIILIVALIIVIKSADLFVDSLVEVGESLGISQIILGVTASAIGTSLPEFGSAMIAVFSGNPDIGVGVVIGSNIWNIAGILGISSLAAGYIFVKKEELKRDGLMTLLTAAILLIFMVLFNDITRIVGVVLVVVYIIYLYILIKSQHKKSNSEDSEEESSESKKPEISGSGNDLVEEVMVSGRSRNKNILISIAGLAGLILGSRLLVYSGVEIGELTGVPQIIMGLFALAIGTSMPELVVTVRSAMKKMHSLSIGTVLGSNIFNILIGIGIPSLFMTIPVDKLAVSFDAPVMIGVTALLIILSYRKSKLSRIGGAVLISAYVAYIVTRIYLSF
ncbi:Na+/Ca+ antiporter, CaCA family [Methanobacterium lacus]|uniref:Na+/Ca+ antiporter, CaCA family n=1 Tax=Methanobacterium lacus (strain AL-21) TaxID=877455 RepID=F0TC49_METLA|nr:calcium/sodium antiporter [Methanobacterium lacus]ADZ09200.1 Na+/Ca+ antiporter, CaCA family [Methanobacterium lacus]